MSARLVAAAISALAEEPWMPRVSHWEIATTDDVWGAHAELDVRAEGPAYREFRALTERVGTEFADDGRQIRIDFEHDDVPVRVWWLRPILRWIVPATCATCPTALGDPDVAFVRLGESGDRDAPVICTACKVRMWAAWLAQGTAEPTGGRPPHRLLPAIRERHAAAAKAGWHLDPEPHTDPDLVRTMVGGWREYIGILKFTGHLAKENREFVLNACGDMGVLFGEIDRLRGEFRNAVATVARLEQKRVELEKTANAERARVTELDAERGELNSMIRSSNAKAAEGNGLRRALGVIVKHGDMSESVRQELRDLLVIPEAAKAGEPA